MKLGLGNLPASGMLIVRAEIKDAEKHLAKDYPEFPIIVQEMKQSCKDFNERAKNYIKENGLKDESEIPASSDIYKESKEIESLLRQKFDATKQKLAELSYDIATGNYVTTCDCCPKE
jgi:hypothetical protein